jgi:Flp pilus assembly protein TadG
MTSFQRRVTEFCRHEDGTASWFSLVPLIFVLILLGLGLDITHAIQQRTHLQVTADAAAHTAIFTRNQPTETEASAKAAALGMAALNMPPARDGNVLRLPNIEFGVWNASTQTFTPNAGSDQAVRVITEQREANGNAVATYLLRLAGFDSWDIRALTTMESYYKDCHQNGFIAEGIIDIQSNSEFLNGFCIISKTHVEINQNNFFEEGTSVQMPNTDDLVIPASGFSHNDGLYEALGPGGYTIKEVALLSELIPALQNDTWTYVEGESPALLQDIDQGTVHLGNNVKSIAQADISDPGKVYTANCGGGQINIKKDTVIEGIVLASNCKLKFESGVVLKDSIVATSNTSAQSVTGPSGISIGAADGCDTLQGGAVILTLGGAQFGAGLEFHDGQIIAQGDVQFPANDFSIEGASVLAGGRIDGTSNMTMSSCPGDGDTGFKEDYFRIVQ